MRWRLARTLLALGLVWAMCLPASSAPAQGVETATVLDAFVGEDDVVYMLSGGTPRAVLRWSLAESRYLPSVLIPEVPRFMAYQPEQQRIALSYYPPSGRLGEIDLAAAEPLEEGAFRELTSSPLWLFPSSQGLLATLQPHLGLANYDWALLDREGSVTGSGPLPTYPEPGTTFAWSTGRERLYYVPGYLRPALARLDLEAGGLAPVVYSAQIRDWAASGYRMWAAPDGSSVVTSGDDRVYDGETLEQTGSLPGSYELRELVWTPQGRVALRVAFYEIRTLEELGDDGLPVHTIRLLEHPNRLLPWGERLVLITQPTFPETPRIRVITPWQGDVDDDGAPDGVDFFDIDPVAGADGDHDGVASPEDVFPDDPNEAFDADGDGRGDRYADVFPWDPEEWSDTDGDGQGDNGDRFPNDPTEWLDSDSDGVGDNADAFPADPSEQSDRDGDRVGDNRDVFPDDPDEQYDFDADGVGDNGDAFPDVAFEQLDSDEDGAGDRDDAFPLDPEEWRDTDEDGVGNLADPTPFGVVDAEARLLLRGKIKLRRFYPATGRALFSLARFGGDRFALCLVDANDCMIGRELSRSANGRKLVLGLDDVSWRYFARDLDAFITEGIGWGPLSITIEPVREKAKLVLSIAKNGRSARLSMRVPHRGWSDSYGNIDGYTSYKGGGSYWTP